jgi:two-component system response regulator MprA
MARILIIEDQTPMRTALADVLEAKVIARSQPPMVQRTSTLLAGKPDLILLDIMMPKTRRLRGLRGAAAAFQSVPVLMLTAKGQVEDRVTGLDAGADGLSRETVQH